ncbi:MAE_28990/MAE_18760 family HEPN-like nuclease [Calothrix rhizosoleniae]|uniref:MAE_28990/MAE_18760 family HEPN-like nuclease n=1 Tax=Calothrix rhizosoleniae TaxID=888997 RepID=UPI000B49853F|nr:MAE_28990/MAE_18760 family HEPN-like nuclease [Calothrix rhizosoleniae]
MFQEILDKARGDISTTRSIIQTYFRLRDILFGEGSITEQEREDCQKITSLKEIAPNKNDWRVYENCAVVTRLYAIYENFVENLVREWIEYLPRIFPNYSDLNEEIQGTHQRGVANLLLKLKNKNINSQFYKDIISSLFICITGENQYEGENKYKLVPDAFLLHEQNLRKEALEQLFTNAGIPNAWNWVNKHINEYSAEIKLKELIDYRNDAAHEGFIDAPLGFDILLELCDFVETLCQALAELVTYRVIEQKKSIGQVKEIGKVTRWFPEPQAARAKIQDVNLSVGDSLFLVSETKGYCKLVKIESIKITENGQDIPKDNLLITDETEVGLKFDKDVREDLSIYMNVVNSPE